MFDEIAAELTESEEAFFAAQAHASLQRSPAARRALKDAQLRLDRAKVEAHRLLFEIA